MHSTQEMLRPARIRPAAAMALVAPAGVVSEEKLAAALTQCAAIGLEPRLGQGVQERLGYLAGPDRIRAQDLAWAFSDPAIAAVWAIRGGYGTMRLLPGLDPAMLRAGARPFIGFSDNTALHLALQRAGIVSFHGPHAGAALPAFTLGCFRAVLFRAEPAGTLPVPVGEEPITTLVPGTAEGSLVGGNLAMLASTCGTPVALEARDRIVFFEDVGEAPYRIDRALTQLRLAGALDGVAGLAFGRFTDCDPDVPGRPLAAIFEEFARTLGVPAVAGIPVGHVDSQWTLPLGIRARLDADAGTLSLLEAAVT